MFKNFYRDVDILHVLVEPIKAENKRIAISEFNRITEAMNKMAVAISDLSKMLRNYKPFDWAEFLKNNKETT